MKPRRQLRAMAAGASILLLSSLASLGGERKSGLIVNLEAGKKQTVVTYGTSLTQGEGGAWVGQLSAELNRQYPGLATVINSGAACMWSKWGVDNLAARVIDKRPDAVFIEFAMNDAYRPYTTTVARARANLETMVDRILATNKFCEVILMVMNPPTGVHLEVRPQITSYYQMYRDVAARRHLRLIDHYPKWDRILKTDPNRFTAYVPDGIHPNAEGCQMVITPTIISGLGMGTEPFIRVREVISRCPNAPYWNDMAPELKRRYFMPLWSEARLRRHLEMLKAFGFNAIQITAVPQVANNAGADQKEWRKRLRFMCRVAKKLGFSVSQFVWATAVDDGRGGCRGLDWRKPEERVRLEAEYRGAAEFAPDVDRVITHWVDPGQPQQGGLDTVVEMHNHILGIFREKNPKIRGALSAWFMDSFAGSRYPGYVDEGTLAANKVLDPNSDVVLGRLCYSCDGINTAGGNRGETLGDRESRVAGETLDAIAAAGRHAGLWGWYTADIETSPALYVRTEILRNYFRNLPPQTRTKLAWHSIDDNCHGLNMQNLYVAGCLMRNPTLDAQKLLDEFAQGFVGSSNAPALAAALRAVELARTRSLNYAKVEEPWLAESASAVDAALTGLKAITLAPRFTPVWPVTMAPADYLDELNAQLKAIRQMLVFLKAAEDVKRLKARGESAAKLQGAVAALPTVVYDPKHVARLETKMYEDKLAALKSAVNAKD